MQEGPIAAGKSSFDLIDRDVFFREIGPIEGTVLLDAACGEGRYATPLAGRVGDRGLVYAIDLWEEGIVLLKAAIGKEGVLNIRPLVADVCRTTLEDNAVDAVLMATVIHDLAQAGTAEGALAEARRVLRPDGRLWAVEFLKIDGPPGPPRQVRISREELRRMAAPFGFREEKSVGTGPVTYLTVFRLVK